MTPVAAVSPAAPYLGGKRNLARRLVDRIATVPHATYVEPFVGMGGVFLRRTAKPRAEVINDLSGDVANFFRIVRRHQRALQEEIDTLLTSRAEFDRLKRLDPTSLTDLERAARFLYLQRLSFGGKITGRSFGVDRRTPGRFNAMLLTPILRRLHQRLAGVVIEQLPYADVIRRYDGPETLFYLDPPYWGCERDYGDGFGRADFEALAGQLSEISGRFILSINATPGAREVFSRFHVKAVETTWTISTASAVGAKRVTELIVSNRPA